MATPISKINGAEISALSASYAITASYALTGGSGGGSFVPSAWTGSSTSQFSGTASFAATASSFRVGNSTIISDGSSLRISANSLNISSSTTVTGSFTVVSGSNIELRVTNTGVTIGNTLTDTHNITGSVNITGSLRTEGNIELAGGLIDASAITNTIFIGDAGTTTITNMLGTVALSPGNNGYFQVAPPNGSFLKLDGVTGNTKLGDDITRTISITGSTQFTGSITMNGPLSVASLQTNPGTTTIAPIVIASGSNLTTPISGAIEYDGTVIYSTNDASSRRGYIPSVNIFRLTSNGSAITGVGNFFGANSAIQLAAGGIYEVEAYCYFLKTTSSTISITASLSSAPVNLNGIVQYGLITNGAAAGAANQIGLFNSTNANAAFALTGTLTTAVNHAFTIRLAIEANANTSNLRINFTPTSGTLTPLRGSYYKVIKLPSSNTGNFVA